MARIINLNHREAFEVIPTKPFNFDGTVYVPQHFPVPDFEWSSGICWQAINFNGKPIGVRLEDRGATDRPEIRLSVYSTRRLAKEEVKSLIEELSWRYGLSEDISEFCLRFRADRFLRLPLKRLRGMRVNCANSVYELLMIAVSLQNATVRRSVQMMENLLNAYGLRLRFDGKELFAYWRPEDLNSASESDLRRLKVGYRARMIKRISEGFLKGDMDELKFREMGTDRAREELMRLYGVGPATSQIIINEYLREYETLGLEGMVWERKILSRILFNKRLVSEKRILGLLGARYGRWRGLAYHYLITDLFWRHRNKSIGWLTKEIRL